jgi:hypothetical protein
VTVTSVDKNQITVQFNWHEWDFLAMELWGAWGDREETMAEFEKEEGIDPDAVPTQEDVDMINKIDKARGREGDATQTTEIVRHKMQRLDDEKAQNEFQLTQYFRNVRISLDDQGLPMEDADDFELHARRWMERDIAKLQKRSDDE